MINTEHKGVMSFSDPGWPNAQRRAGQARGWRTQVEEGSGRRLSWTLTAVVVADILVILSVYDT